MTKNIKLYSPAIVLLLMAIGEAAGWEHMHGSLLAVLAVAVVIHIRTAVRHD